MIKGLGVLVKFYLGEGKKRPLPVSEEAGIFHFSAREKNGLLQALRLRRMIMPPAEAMISTHSRKRGVVSPVEGTLP